jgi:anti-sigma regulatory factor (Ser/Thr protein kinase)
MGTPTLVTLAERTAQVVLALPPDPSAARRARIAMHKAGMPEDLQHTVDLLATELIANSIRHAGLRADEEILFAARFAGDFVRVEVHDPGPGFEVERALEGKGFGLRMVDKLATRWGVEHGSGVRIWFEVDRRPQGRFPRRRRAR